MLLELDAMSETRADSRYDLFVSYRREGGATTALFLRERLMHCGLRVFLDIVDLKNGYFDEALLREIEETPNFLVILSQQSLDRCENADDWLGREIAHAIRTERNIIPLLMEGFQFPPTLPENLRSLPRHQGVLYSYTYHEAMVGKILQSIEVDQEKRKRKAAPLSPSPPDPVTVRDLAATEEMQGRVLDAAMAQEIPVGKPTELTTMIRRVDSAGLKAVLEIDGGDARPDDVRSKPFELEFPVDAQGRRGAAELVLRVDSPDFEPPVQAKKLRVPPRADSETYSFLLTPKFTGDLRVNLELCKGDVCVASRVLRTSGAPSDRMESTAKVLVSMPLSVKGVDARETRRLESPSSFKATEVYGVMPKDTAIGSAAAPASSEWPARPEIRVHPGSDGTERVAARSPNAAVAMAPTMVPSDRNPCRSLAELFGVQRGAEDRMRNTSFIAAWMGSVYLLTLLGAHWEFRSLLHWTMVGAMEAFAVLGALWYFRKLRYAAPVAGLVCFVITLGLAGILGHDFGAFVFPEQLPEFFEITVLIWVLGMAIRKIGNLWLALTVGMMVGLYIGSTVGMIVLAIWEKNTINMIGPIQICRQVISSMLFATVIVWMARRSGRSI